VSSGFPLLTTTSEVDYIPSVVAVCGLGGHAFGSWTHRESGRMWLRDFLPQDLENLRIMTYGYNSSLKDSKKASEETMVDYRREFITALEDVRSTAEVIHLCLLLSGI
jgi:hypothetical protein